MPTQKDKLKKLLDDNQWHHMSELNAICYRYSARLYDLEQDGYKWEKKQIARGEFKYRKTPPDKTSKEIIEYFMNKNISGTETPNSIQETLL